MAKSDWVDEADLYADNDALCYGEDPEEELKPIEMQEIEKSILDNHRRNKDMADKKYCGEKMRTPECRIAFANVFKVNDNGKYSVALLIPKTDTAALNVLKQAAVDLALSYFDVKTIQELPDTFKWPFKDGDEPNSAGNTFDGYLGNIVINASTGENNRPKVVGPTPGADDKFPELDANEFYSGCYARAMITPFAYSNKGTGISFFLGNIQKMRDGERFGGGAAPESDFTAVDPGTAAPTSTDPLGI